jgi:hypothetical protein
MEKFEIIEVVKSRRMTGKRHVARMGKNIWDA